MADIRISKLVKLYDNGYTAVKGIDLHIRDHEFMVLVGPSGCGKTTTLRMIAGLEQASAGRIFIDGVDVTAKSPGERDVSMVFQSYALFPHLTVTENVGFSLSLRRGVADAAQRVARALDAVHMSEFGARYPHQLSGGQQQRVAVARAIVAEPRLLLLDEPLSALDRKMRAHLQVELKDLQRRLGIAFIYVTHDQEEAFALSDIVVVMNKGRIAQKADPRTIYNCPADSFVADFIGGSTLVEGRVISTGAYGATLESPLGTIAAPASTELNAGDRAVLVVRPEAVSDRPGVIALSGTVTHTVYQGERTLVGIMVAGFELRFASDHPPAIGTTLPISLDPQRLFITRMAA